MKIGRISLADGLIYFEVRGAAIEPCAYLGINETTTSVGAGWLDISEAKGIPYEIISKPTWNVRGAIQIAQDTFREIDKAGPEGAPYLARLSVTSPEFWTSTIDKRSRLQMQVARDIFILLMLPVWERRKWSGGQRGMHLDKLNMRFSKVGDTNRIMLANRITALRKRFS